MMVIQQHTHTHIGCYSVAQLQSNKIKKSNEECGHLGLHVRACQKQEKQNNNHALHNYVLHGVQSLMIQDDNEKAVIHIIHLNA